MIQMERDVIIVGAGPAGAICAAYLAKAGVDVLLLDKEIFPRDKACGDMLREELVAHVSELGAFGELDAMGTCIRHIKLMGNDGAVSVVPFECYCVPRYEFDSLMVRTAVRWGAEFQQGCRVLGVLKERGFVTGVKVKFRGREYGIRSRLVIGADGAYSTVAKALGVMQEASAGMYLGQRAYFKGVKLERSLARGQYDAYGIFSFDAAVKPEYFWIMPAGVRGVQEGYCNVGMLVKDRDSYKNPGLQERFAQWRDSSREISELFASAEQVSPWKGGKLSDVTQDIRAAGNGFLLIGDAASVMLPLFHDGLSAAADSAKAAAAAAVAAMERNDCSEALLTAEYERGMQDRRLSEDEWKSRRLMIESMYDPSVMDRVIRRLEQDPGYRKQVLKEGFSR